MARYKEAMGWKQCVEDIMKEGGYSSLDEVQWDNIRMGEMQGKIKLWGELQSKNLLEMTPSKLQAVLSNTEAFVEGINNGQMQIEQAKQQLQLAQVGSPEPQPAEVRHFKIKQEV
jgi:hypothetical protein